MSKRTKSKRIIGGGRDPHVDRKKSSPDREILKTKQKNEEPGDKGGGIEDSKFGDLRTGDIRFRELADTVFDIVYEFDLQGKIVYGNQAAIDAFVPKGAKATDISVRDTMAKKDHAASAKDIQSIFQGQKVFAERTFLRADGTSFIGEVHSGPVYENGKICGVRGVIRDITERKKAEGEIKEKEARFRALFELSPQPVVVSDPDTGKIFDVNEKFCLLSGYTREDAIGQTSTELGLFTKEHRDGFVNALMDTGELSGLEMSYTNRDGDSVETLLYARKIKTNKKKLLLTVVVDVTELRRLERALNQTTKMEALGLLAGGLAHDFNNLLMTIQGNISLITADSSCLDVYKDEMKNIQYAIMSGTRLVRGLLDFTSEHICESQPIDMTQLVSHTVELFTRTHKGLRVKGSYATTPCVCNVDKGQIEQVFLNLLINAFQATTNGEEITVKTFLVDITEHDNRLTVHTVEQGLYVAVEVKDHGIGMNQETLERVFEPFFTTKQKVGGYGLGLASAYGVVKSHGGFIHVESAPGRGSVFTVYMPHSSEKPQQEYEPPILLATGNELILLVDDEYVVRRTAQQMLAKLGYEVLCASNGDEALALLDSHKEEISLVMLDMIMPGMNGGEVLREIRQRGFGGKVLVSSGFIHSWPVGWDPKVLSDGILKKPYTLAKLSEKVRALLDGS